MPTMPIYYLRNLINDRDYFRRLFTLALPIIVQQFLFSSLNLISTLLVGQLGETSVAAVGLSGQIAFLLNLLLFGVNSGASIFFAQYWGQRDIPNIQRVMGLALSIGLFGATVFSILALFFPAFALSIYSEDPQVVALGKEYLRILGLSFFMSAIIYTFSSTLRSTGQIRLPVTVSASSLALNTLLSYLLIFGYLGLPELGILGPAIATVISRMLEMAVLLFLSYKLRTPAAARLKDMFSWNRKFIIRTLQRVLPVTLNEVFWSFGITTYNIIYARIGTEAIAAINIASTIDSLAFVFFIGVGNACAILVGNTIGESDEERAFRYAGHSLLLAVLTALIIGLIVFISSGFILAFYKVSPDVIDYARRILLVISATIWVRAANMVLFVGVFRSGGDTSFGLALDGGTIWVVGVPSAAAAAFIFHLPVYWVYLVVMSEEFTKFIVGLWRYLSKKWIHNLTIIHQE